jgi:hypothetical protein
MVAPWAGEWIREKYKRDRCSVESRQGAVGDDTQCSAKKAPLRKLARLRFVVEGADQVEQAQDVEGRERGTARPYDV